MSLIPMTALVLAAGRSLRMGFAKAWLSFQGQSLLVRVACAAQDGGATRVVVVAGTDAEAPTAGTSPDEANLVTTTSVVAALADPIDDLITVVGRPDQHPIDSIRAGLRFVAPGHALLLWPVDHPFAGASVVRALRRALEDGAGPIAVPSVQERSGHPVLLGPEVVAELGSPLADTGAHAVVRRDPSRVVRVPIADSRITAALNTPEQASALGVERPEDRRRQGPVKE